MSTAFSLAMLFGIISDIIVLVMIVSAISIVSIGYIVWVVNRWEDCLWKFMTAICGPIFLFLIISHVLKQHGLL